MAPHYDGGRTFINIDGFDSVRVVDANTNKFHPYPAKVFVEASLFMTVPRELIGALKLSSPTILIDELTQKVTGRCASLTISAVTLNFVIALMEQQLQVVKNMIEELKELLMITY